MVQREAPGQRAHPLPHPGDGLLIRDMVQHFGDQRAGLAHLVNSKSASGHGGRSQADAAGVKRRVDVEGDGVLVDGNARPVEGLFGLLAADSLAEYVEQQQVRIGAAGDHAEAGVH